MNIRQHLQSLVLPEPVSVLSEQLSLSIKAGRRCMHDLSHAVDHIEHKETRLIYQQRVDLWHSIFYADDGVKNYRHKLHHEIDRLQRDNARLRALCISAGVDPADPESLPF